MNDYLIEKLNASLKRGTKSGRHRMTDLLLTADLFQPEETLRPPSQSGSVFLALLPTPDEAARVIDRLQEWQRRYKLQGTPKKAEQLHVCLHPINKELGLSKHLLHSVDVAATEAAHSTPPFEVRFAELNRSVGAVLVLRDIRKQSELTSLHQLLSTRLVRNSVRTNKDGIFTPQMALLHGVQPFSTLIDPVVKLTFREIALVRARAGAPDEILNRWPLRDPGQA